MRERDHNNLEYEGGPGEKVKVTITPHGSTLPVTYKLDGGATQAVAQGAPIELNLKNKSGQRTDLQVITDGNAEGSYDLVIDSVPNCVKDVQHVGVCARTRRVPPKKISLFAFFVV